VPAIGRQPRRAPDGAPVDYERHRPEQATLYRLAQQHAAAFFAETEAAAGADLPQFVKPNLIVPAWNITAMFSTRPCSAIDIDQGLKAKT
jgi:hypothetical protein